MIKIILLGTFYLLFPVVIIWLCKKWALLQKIGTIGVAYLFGLLLSGIGIFPDGSEQYKLALNGRAALPDNEIETLVSDGRISEDDIYANQIASVQDTILSVVVLIAFPLLLFSMNIKRWLRVASTGFLSIILGLVAGVIMVTIGFFIWKDSFPESAKLAAMFEAMYTGGSPNFAALQVALKVDPTLFVMATTYDIVVGAILVLFFITIAPKIFRFILPEYKNDEKIPTMAEQDIRKETTDPDDFTGMFEKSNILPLLKGLGVSLIIVAVSYGFYLVFGKYFPENSRTPIIILGITIFGILASLIKNINRIQKTFQLGMYLILVFSLTIASMSDLETMLNITMLRLILFITWCYWGSLLLHLILAKIFRIDADNFLITSTALIFSPPFVPLVARYLKNKDLIATGITGGLFGLMVGNIVGIALSFFLSRF
jgi:uncharacterized membrane protein